MIARETCRSCRFWLAEENGPSTDTDDTGRLIDNVPAFGWCRRDPPRINDRMAQLVINPVPFGSQQAADEVANIVVVQEASLFPATWCNFWCGQYQRLSDDADFRAALAEYRRAKAAYRMASSDDERAVTDNAVVKAWQAIAATFAPTPAAVRDKLEIMLAEILSDSGAEMERDHLRPVLDDLNRIAGGA